MFVHPVRHEGASTLAAGDQIPDLLRTHLRFEGVAFGWCLQGLFRLRLLPHRSFINVGLPDHGVRLAGLLVGDQRFLIEPSSAILAFHQCLLDIGVKRLGVELIDIVARDDFLAEEGRHGGRRLWAGSPLFGRLQILFVFPLLFAGLDMEGQTLGSEPVYYLAYSRPQMQQTRATGLFILDVLIIIPSCTNSQVPMLVHRLNRFHQSPLRISELSSDPHGELVVLRTHAQRIILCQVLALMRYFQVYRHLFKSTKQYSCHQELPICLQISPSLKHQICKVSLSERQEGGEQFLVIFYSKNIETVLVDTRKKSIGLRQIFDLQHQLIYSVLVGGKIYLTMYNLTMASLDIMTMKVTEDRRGKSSQSTPETKDTLRRKEIIRFLEEEGGSPKLWQTAGGMLMSGCKIVAQEFLELMDISNSYEEYQFRQLKDFTPVKYELSPCKYYLLGRQNIDDSPENLGVTVLRSKMVGWGQICELQFKPQINPYWTYYYKYEKQARTGTRKGQGLNPKEDRLLVASINNGKKQIVVSWIVVNLQSRKKISSEEGQQALKYGSRVSSILRVRQIKHDVTSLKWIGLSQFVYSEQNGQLYFCEFQNKYLKF